jgi:cytochrome c oxidase subunit 2
MLTPFRKKLFFSSFLFLLFSGSSYGGKPTPWQVWYQESASPVMDRINEMHTYLLYIIFGIAIFVTALLLITIYKFRESKNKTPSKVAHNTFLEIVWTLIPLIIVCAIAIPSIKLIYYMDKTHDAEMTLKVIGHQWYWEYDYPDHKISFDSYMLEGEKLKPEHLRYLDVDKQVVLPVETNVRILATSADVLHSWAVPAFGIKQDTIPGRLRETWVRIKKPGVYYGQCSELCGLNHGFMSIAVKAVPKAEFEAWVRQEGGEIPAPEAAEAPATATTQTIADPHAVPPAPNADLQSTPNTQ